MFLLRHSVCFSVTVWITPLSSSFSRTACHELFFVQQRNGHCTPINVEGALYENMAGIENIPFFRCGTEYIDLLLIRAVGIQAGAELEIGSIVRAQLAAVRGTVGTFSSGDHMVHGVLNMAQSFVSLVAHLASPRFFSGAIRSL